MPHDLNDNHTLLMFVELYVHVILKGLLMQVIVCGEMNCNCNLQQDLLAFSGSLLRCWCKDKAMYSGVFGL